MELEKPKLWYKYIILRIRSVVFRLFWKHGPDWPVSVCTIEDIIIHIQPINKQLMLLVTI